MAHVCIVTNDTESLRLYSNDPHAREQAVRSRDAVSRALADLGHHVSVATADPLLLERLIRLKPEAVFNLATGYNSRKDQAVIAALLEISGIEFTGPAAQAHVLGLHKHLAKMMMGLYGVPTPKFKVIGDVNLSLAEDDFDLRFPVIVKPAAEGSSAGISPDSIAVDSAGASNQIRVVCEHFGPPALVEEFVEGREFTVGLVGYPEPVPLPVEEIIFRQGSAYTYEVKTKDAVDPVCPAQISDREARRLQDLALRTFHAIGCRDLARVDIRVSRDGLPYVLEINTLPGLMPGYSEIPRMAEMTGMTYAELIGRVLEGALYRLRAQAEREPLERRRSADGSASAV